jgi:chromate reductase
MTDKKILVLGASNSRKSINKELATYAAKSMERLEYRVLDLNDFEMPLYSTDLENEKGQPEAANNLSELFDEYDGFVVSLAEHNGSYSAAFKNTYDWLSRINGKVWRSKPMLLLSTSPGGRGGKTVMEAALNTFPRMGAVVTGYFSLPSFNMNFDQEEGIIDQKLSEEFHMEVKKFEDSLVNHLVA